MSWISRQSTVPHRFACRPMRGYRLADYSTLQHGSSGRLSVMKEKTDLWMKLCVDAAIERNPEKFLELKNEICKLLQDKEQRLLAIIESKRGNC